MVVLYRHRKTGEFLLQENCRHPEGGYTDYGPPIPINEEEYRNQLSERLLESLAMCAKRTPGEVPYEEPDNLEREYDTAYVVSFDDGTLEISARMRAKGQYQAKRVASVREDEARARMRELIDAAFECTS
jgi:hypothetical protein